MWSQSLHWSPHLALCGGPPKWHGRGMKARCYIEDSCRVSCLASCCSWHQGMRSETVWYSKSNDYASSVTTSWYLRGFCCCLRSLCLTIMIPQTFQTVWTLQHTVAKLHWQRLTCRQPANVQQDGFRPTKCEKGLSVRTMIWRCLSITPRRPRHDSLE